MGALIEINDTLKLKRGINLPSDIKLGGVYNFTIQDRRLYHLKPTRVFLVEDIDGKWNYLGHAMILQQTIDAVENTTSGIFEVVQIYDREYAAMMNQKEAPVGKGYAGESKC